MGRLSDARELDSLEGVEPLNILLRNGDTSDFLERRGQAGQTRLKRIPPLVCISLENGESSELLNAERSATE